MGNFSVENLRKFVEDVVNDKLEPHMKSEEPPEEQGDVKVCFCDRVKFSNFLESKWRLHYKCYPYF